MRYLVDRILIADERKEGWFDALSSPSRIRVWWFVRYYFSHSLLFW